MFTGNYMEEIAGRVHVEHDDGQFVFLAEGERGHVHHFQVFLDGFAEGEVLKFNGVRIFFRVAVVDTVYTGAF